MLYLGLVFWFLGHKVFGLLVVALIWFRGFMVYDSRFLLVFGLAMLVLCRLGMYGLCCSLSCWKSVLV